MGGTPAGPSRNSSKNQLVWARCHLVGLAIWHGLQLLVFRGQGQSKRFGAGSHPKKALGERVAIVAVIHP